MYEFIKNIELNYDDKSILKEDIKLLSTLKNSDRCFLKYKTLNLYVGKNKVSINNKITIFSIVNEFLF